MRSRGRRTFRVQILIGMLLASYACTRAARQENASSLAVSADHQVLSDTVPSDTAMESLVSPFRDQMRGATSRVIGVATAQFNEARPEGALGNLVADAMLHVIQTQVNDTVHMAVTNNGGLRVPIREGPVTVGEIFEVAPFENFLTVIELNGVQLQSLANDIARVGGEPIAGFTFHIDVATGRAGDVRIGGQAVREEQTYRLVTLDYLIEGGDRMRTLWSIPPQMTTSVLLRDAIIQYIQFRNEIQPELEDRIIRVAR